MNKISRSRFAALAVAAWLASAGPAALAQERWQEDIQTFEAQDRTQPPPQNGILFVGSSSIVRWDLEKYFPDLPVINRGFGGSEISDSPYYADRIVMPYAPRTVVFYAGDNDIGNGKSAEQVAADFEAFSSKVLGALPGTRIVFIAIKPSLKRWDQVGEMRRANAIIRAATEENTRLDFVDVDSPMIGADGTPRPELFVDDGLHLSPAGYELWTSLVRPYLPAPGGDSHWNQPTVEPLPLRSEQSGKSRIRSWPGEEEVALESSESILDPTPSPDPDPA